MPKHIRAVHIDSFRGIRNLHLEELAPVNIITGDNNSGKTSVLEVMESLDNPGSFRMWRSLIRKERFALVNMGMTPFEGLSGLFPVNGEGMRISYKVDFSDGTSNGLEVDGSTVEESLPVKEMEKLAVMVFHAGDEENDEENGEKEENVIDVEKLRFSVFLDEELILDSGCYDVQTRFRLERNINHHLADVNYISPVRHAEGTVFLNSVLDNPELYEQMIQVLREFDPGIISINVDNANEKYRRGNIYKILSKEHKRALPLNVYGDGMKKAILLMSAVIRTQGGILLLDEFETAIHTTAMEKVFRWILETCIKLDVQLFLTTHSEEAIDKILKCSPVLQDKMKVFTLYKKEDGTVARVLDARKAIEIKDEMGIELR